MLVNALTSKGIEHTTIQDCCPDKFTEPEREGGEGKQEEEQQKTFHDSELADLQRELSDVKTLVKTLISQVQMARQEIGELKKKK